MEGQDSLRIEQKLRTGWPTLYRYACSEIVSIAVLRK